MIKTILLFMILGLPVAFWLFIFICMGMLLWIIISKSRENKKHRDHHDPEKARKMVHTTGGLTPPFGFKTIRLNENKWVIIEWDKHKNFLNIWEPAHTWETPYKDKLAHGTLNWKIIREEPRVYTTVERHFKRQVM